MWASCTYLKLTKNIFHIATFNIYVTVLSYKIIYIYCFTWKGWQLYKYIWILSYHFKGWYVLLFLVLLKRIKLTIHSFAYWYYIWLCCPNLFEVTNLWNAWRKWNIQDAVQMFAIYYWPINEANFSFTEITFLS